MNKKALLISGAILVMIISAGTYAFMNDGDKQAKDQILDTATTKETLASDPQRSNSVDLPIRGSYVEYKEGAIEAIHGTKLLFFYAPWCPQCRALETDIKNNTIPPEVTIIKVDYDTNQQLRKKYGVTLQTTIVRIDDQGQLVKKFVAYDDPSLKSVVDNLL